MGVASAIVLYLVVWFMTFLIALPIRVQTQGDLGEIVHGTHAGAPEHHHLRKKFKIVTAVSFVIWAILAYIIITGAITVRDLDFFDRMGPPARALGTE